MSSTTILDTSAVIALLLAAADVHSFPPRMWPHHRALHEIAVSVTTDSAFRAVVERWQFRPSADGGYALPDLDRTFLRMSGEGWLRRSAEPHATYQVSEEMTGWGHELRERLPPDDRRLVDRCAQRLKAALNTASK